MSEIVRRGADVVANPEVSIVVLFTDKTGYLIECLAALGSLEPEPAHEVLVVANGTPATQLKTLRQREDIVLLPVPANLGFAGGNNWGARFARGQFLVFLNDDTAVESDWLRQLAATAQGDNEAGAVGSRLLNSDGSLQEAGAILWNDGTTSQVGSGLRPENKRFNQEREVDYASGCGLLVKREAWDAAGGFDENYFPAYHEDVDLCLQMRNLGFRVLFSPHARVRHHGGGSMDPVYRDFAAQKNGRYFIRKWEQTLKLHLARPVTQPTLDEIEKMIEPLPPMTNTKPRISAAVPPDGKPGREAMLQACVNALQKEVAIKDEFIRELRAGSPALGAELERLRADSAKLEKLRTIARRVPLGRKVARALARRAEN